MVPLLVLVTLLNSVAHCTITIPPFFYNASSALLFLEQPFLVSFYQVDVPDNTMTTGKLGQALATVNLPNSSYSTVTGKQIDDKFLPKYILGISYASGSIKGDNVTLTKADLTFEMTLNTNTSYWSLSGLNVVYEGTIGTNGSSSQALSFNESLVVAPKPGFTSLPEDLNCQRGYTSCAPVNLCWRCSDQQLFGNTTVKGSKLVSGLTMPGIVLQPLIANGTQQFGYPWNCDPVFSSALWVGLLLTIGLAMVVYWAVDMLTNLHTPNKFDDPRGKPISVPLND